MHYNFIIVEGNIGAGKTTLCTKLAEHFNAKLILEQFADNPFLPKFYENQGKYAFPLELSFLASRYHQLKHDLSQFENNTPNSFTVADYYFMKSLIFAKNTLPTDEYKLYKNIFDIIYQMLPKPDLFVYLDVRVDNVLLNIKKRGRDYEKNMSATYLDKIERGYFEFFEMKHDFPVLILDTNNIDFVDKHSDYKKLVEAISKPYHQAITRIKL